MGKMGSYLKLRVYHFNSVETEKRKWNEKTHPKSGRYFFFSILNERVMIGTECQQGGMAG